MQVPRGARSGPSVGHRGKMTLTAAVVTSSIGRDTLSDTIEAVQRQTYPARHTVFVNGPEFHERGRAILERYPDVLACYLPAPGTVKGVPGPESVYGAAPFLTTADVIFYCNDDDIYDPDHVASMMTLIERERLDWAYSLRRIVGMDLAPVAEDDCESLGYWPCFYGPDAYLVDVSSYAVRRQTAISAAPGWYVSPIGDRVFLRALKQVAHAAGCTGRSTVRYRLQPGPGHGTNREFFERGNAKMTGRYPGGFPWRRETVFRRPEPSSR